MNQEKTGQLIRRLRQANGLTQFALAEKLQVTDKAISKWERGCGMPDLTQLEHLAKLLDVSLNALLSGTMEENDLSSGNFKKLQFYVCPVCGNLLFSSDGAEIHCCGRTLEPLIPQKATEPLQAESIEQQWYLSSGHEMRKEHYISFVAFLTGDSAFVKKLYPEWNLSFRLPMLGHGMLLWYCTTHGLFYQYL